MYLFDTDHLTILQRRTQPEYSRLATRTLAHPPSAFYCSIISFHEQALGWITYINRARNGMGIIRGYQMFEHLLADFSTSQIASFDTGATAQFESLRDQRVRIGTMDLRIAAIALSNNLTLLSRNLADFRQVPNLKVEDWTC